MFCSRCGAKNGEDALFCSRCGHKLVSNASESAEKSTDVEWESPITEQRSKDEDNVAEGQRAYEVQNTIKSVVFSPWFVMGLLVFCLYALLAWGLPRHAIDWRAMGNLAEFFGVRDAGTVGEMTVRFQERLVQSTEIGAFLTGLPAALAAVALTVIFLNMKSHQKGVLATGGFTMLQCALVGNLLVIGYRFWILFSERTKFAAYVEQHGANHVSALKEFISSLTAWVVVGLLVKAFFCFKLIQTVDTLSDIAATGTPDQNGISTLSGVLCYIFSVGALIEGLASVNTVKIIAYTAYAVSYFIFGQLIFRCRYEMKRLLSIDSQPNTVDLAEEYPGYFAHFDEQKTVITNYDPRGRYPEIAVQQQIEIYKQTDKLCYMISFYDALGSTEERASSYYAELAADKSVLYEQDTYFADEESKTNTLGYILAIADYALKLNPKADKQQKLEGII